MHLSLAIFGIWSGVSFLFVGGRARQRHTARTAIIIVTVGAGLSVLEIHRLHPSLRELVAGFSAGVGLGSGTMFVVLLLLGFAMVSVPLDVVKGIDIAKDLLVQAEGADATNLLAAQGALEQMSDAAARLTECTGTLRDSVGLFSQGRGTAGWNAIEQARTILERLGTKLAVAALNRAALAESSELAFLWRSIAQDQRFYSESLNSAINSLASRISFYNLATALIVSAGALLSTVIIGVIQLSLA